MKNIQEKTGYGVYMSNKARLDNLQNTLIKLRQIDPEVGSLYAQIEENSGEKNKETFRQHKVCIEDSLGMTASLLGQEINQLKKKIEVYESEHPEEVKEILEI